MLRQLQKEARLSLMLLHGWRVCAEHFIVEVDHYYRNPDTY